jgi:polyhydroxyalkanoate synthesis regulator phasin
MAQNDMLKRYLDAGLAFTQMTRTRAEGIVKDLVKAGEIQREQTQERVEELVDRSRKNTEQLIDIVRKEISQQLRQLNVVTRQELNRLESRLGRGGSRSGGTTAGPKPTPTAAAPVKKAAKAVNKAVKKTAKAPAKKATPAKKAPAKKATPAKKAGGAKKA